MSSGENIVLERRVSVLLNMHSNINTMNNGEMFFSKHVSRLSIIVRILLFGVNKKSVLSYRSVTLLRKSTKQRIVMDNTFKTPSFLSQIANLHLYQELLRFFCRDKNLNKLGFSEKETSQLPFTLQVQCVSETVKICNTFLKFKIWNHYRYLHLNDGGLVSLLEAPAFPRERNKN